MYKDEEKLDECLEEISPGAQDDINVLLETLENSLAQKRAERIKLNDIVKSPQGIGRKGIKELFFVLLKQGFL